jgi:glycosyltransferase involved in cell wall biosynthesis
LRNPLQDNLENLINTICDHTDDPLDKPIISFIVPVFNEAKILCGSIKELVRNLEALNMPFEVIVANDGSSDGTLEVAQQIAREDERVKVFSIPKNMGRGEVILSSFKYAKGRVIGFTDVDMAADLRHLSELLCPVLDGSCELSTGSRWLPGAEVERRLARKIISFCYNKLVRIMFRSKVNDHQCGFKAFTRPAFMVLLNEMRIRDGRSWAWDTEILVRAQRHRFRIKEFPVRWKEGKESKFRFLNDSINVFKYIVKLKIELVQGEMPIPNVLEHFDYIAPSYDLLDITSGKRFSIISRKISELLHKQSGHLTLLDLGGGTGHLYTVISNQSRIRYLLLEPSRKMLKWAKAHHKDIQTILAVGEALPLRPETISCVICSEVLEHVQNHNKILAEVRGALTNDGILIVSNPNKIWAPVEAIAEKIYLKPPEGPHLYLTPWKLRRDLKTNRFTILNEESFIHPRNVSIFDRFFSNKLSRNLALKSIILCRKSDV